NESPYHGDFPVTSTFAFDATPAAHVIQETGLLLAIYGTGATLCTDQGPPSCFVEDGALGTLQGNEHFVGLTEAGNGAVIGLVAATDSAPNCGDGCVVQLIDIAARTPTQLASYRPMGAASRLIARAVPSPGRVLY